MNKRGLSQVVTTILLILVVLAAIVIIWAAIRPVLEETSEGITASCITIELEVISCDVSDGEVIVKRNAGAGDVTGVVITREGGTSFVDEDFPIGPLDTVPVDVGSGFLDTTNKVNVAAMIGQGTPCPESVKPAITCDA